MRCRFSDPSLPVGVAAVAKMATRRGERDAITLSKFLWKTSGHAKMEGEVVGSHHIVKKSLKIKMK